MIKLFEQIYREALALESPNVKAYDKELSFIKDTTKKSKLMGLLRQSAYKNVAGAASSTGKYHPKFANGDFGLSRHTKAVVAFVRVICDAFPELNEDTLVTAAIAHDMIKYTTDEDKYTAKNHADDSANKLDSVGLKDEARLVRSHMGRWDAERDKTGAIKKPEQFDEKMLHLADYIASKKFITIDFDDDNNIIEDTNELPSRSELNDKISRYEKEDKMTNGDEPIPF
jgi:23S rRNA maturation-related 3'-5' exoribonuclease YhaM